jgi:hypothetical protein
MAASSFSCLHVVDQVSQLAASPVICFKVGETYWMSDLSLDAGMQILLYTGSFFCFLWKS